MHLRASILARRQFTLETELLPKYESGLNRLLRRSNRLQIDSAGIGGPWPSPLSTLKLKGFADRSGKSKNARSRPICPKIVNFRPTLRCFASGIQIMIRHLEYGAEVVSKLPWIIHTTWGTRIGPFMHPQISNKSRFRRGKNFSALILSFGHPNGMPFVHAR